MKLPLFPGFKPTSHYGLYGEFVNGLTMEMVDATVLSNDITMWGSRPSRVTIQYFLNRGFLATLSNSAYYLSHV